MRALRPDVVDAVWQTIEPLLPIPEDTHPLGCHRPRTPDRTCFRGILIRLVTGCSWTTVEVLMDHVVSDTTLRARRDEWVAAGVFDTLANHALAAYDRIIGLNPSESALDSSQHKAPCGGPGTGSNRCDRGRCGWKWSLLTDAFGIPLGWISAAANRHDSKLVADTLAEATTRGLLAEIDTLHMDRGYDYAFVRAHCADLGIPEVIIPRKRKPGHGRRRRNAPIGRRWTIERTNSWLSDYGQLRRNTDRQPAHRDAQLALAITLILTIKLIAWRDRWSPIR